MPAARAEDRLAEEAMAWFVRMNSDPVSEADHQAFQQWLEQDPAHRSAYDRAVALWDELGGAVDPRSTPDEVVAFDRSTRRMNDEPRRPSGIRWRPVAVAASALLALVITLGPFGGYENLRADHITAVGETESVTLPDGSRIDLNTDTALAVDYSDDRRLIRLYRGEAFFSVAPDVGRPFEVRAGNGVSRAVGTAFDVYERDQAVDVSVTEGRVRVLLDPNADSGSDDLLLKAGDAAHYDADGQVSTAGFDPTTRTAWRKGKLVFVDQPLREVIAELDRYRPGTILFLGAPKAEARFTGVFDLQRTDRALDAIENTLSVDVVELTPYLSLLKSPR